MFTVSSTTPYARCEDSPVIPMLDDSQTWSHLPPLADGQRQALPGWARLLAESLPRTTSVMLELDALHRAHSPLGAVLAGKVRWWAANANRCPCGMAGALADLRRASLSGEEIVTFVNGTGDVADAERQAMRFARRLTLEADTITDDEVASLIKTFGEAKFVAMVLLVAHANFQDRLTLALGATAELGDPVPPLEAHFAKVTNDAQLAVPPRIMPEPAAATVVPEFIDDPEWRSLDFADLQKKLARQRLRPPRIRVPPWEEVAGTYPEDQRPPHPVRIVWTLVCRGYQPRLAAGWTACLRTFAEEAKQDRVFEESVFWIITRTIHCFY